MKNSILKITLVGLLVCWLAGSAAAFVPFRVPIKLMHKTPSANSEVVYEIPIEVTLLGMTEDLNWFRARIKFEFALIKCDYTGWLHIPVGETFKLPKLAPQNIP